MCTLGTHFQSSFSLQRASVQVIALVTSRTQKESQGNPRNSKESQGIPRRWGDFGVTLGCLWDNFGITLGDFLYTLGLLVERFGSTLGILWEYLGSNLGVLRKYFVQILCEGSFEGLLRGF